MNYKSILKNIKRRKRHRKERKVLLKDFPSSIIIPKKPKFLLNPEDILKVYDNRESVLEFDPDAQNYSLERLIEDSLRNETAIVDLKIDDRDFPMAPNFFEFLTGKNFLKIKPFARQIQVGMHLFAEFNPKLSNMEWVKNIPVDATVDDFLENVQFLEYGVCPKSGITKSELMHKGLLTPYTQLAGLAGQRSSKSTFVAMLLSYLVMNYIKMQNPAKLFGLLDSGTIFHITLVSLSYALAKESLYDPMHEMMNNCIWFQEYHKMLDHFGNKYGEELYKFKDTFFLYKHRGIQCVPSGPDQRKLRGRTRIAGAIDEIGWLTSANNSKSVKFNANEIHTAMLNSMQTVVSAWEKLILRGDNNKILPPMFANISSPSSQYDKINSLVEDSKKDKSIYAFHYPTWDFNPNISYEFLYSRYGHDRIKFWRDFGAVAPMSASTFIDDEKFYVPISNGAMNMFNIMPLEITTKTEKKMTSGKLIINWSDNKIPKILSLDAGEVKNSFALSVGHIENEKVVLDGLTEIIPLEDTKINFTDIYNRVISPIIQKFNIKMVVADRWQSTKLLSDIEEEFGILTEKYSVKYEDFGNFKNSIQSYNLSIPSAELKHKKILKNGSEEYPHSFTKYPISHFIFQCLTVKDMIKTVTKGDNTDDDIFRSAVLAHRFLIHPEYRELFVGKQEVINVGSAISAGRSSGYNRGNSFPVINNNSNIVAVSIGRSSLMLR